MGGGAIWFGVGEKPAPGARRIPGVAFPAKRACVSKTLERFYGRISQYICPFTVA
jgi:hypothetical protein